MIRHRVIPSLLIQNGGLVKTVKFSNPKYVGDPINAIRIFNEKEADELIVLDISATRNGSGPDFELVEQISGECFMPLTYGGGIRNLDDAQRLFALGVEKLCLQSAALADLDIVRAIAKQFGSQSVLVSVDVKKNWLGKNSLFSSRTRKKLQTSWSDFVKSAVDAGAGEILVNAVDSDGMMCGMDLDLIKQASLLTSVPLLAAGGVGSLGDIRAALAVGASGVSVGSFFVFHGPHKAVLITYPTSFEIESL